MNTTKEINNKTAGAQRKGFGLVELMVALATGLIVSTAVVAFLLSSFKSNSDYVQSTRLTQELRNSLDLVTREIRRSGYDENSLNYMGSGQGSPFLSLILDTEITPSTTPKSYKCAIYRYDRTGGTGGVLDRSNGEVRGLRLIDTVVNGRTIGVIEIAESTASDPSPKCDDATADYTNYPPACTGAWCALSDLRGLNITQLSFTDERAMVGAAPNQIQVRDVGVALQGQLAGSGEYTRGVKSGVRVRSDCFLETLGHCNTPP